jgi:ribosomal protein L17
MSCYFRHMKDIFEEAGIEVTEENKKAVDQVVHELVSVKYKNCSPAWKAVKEQIKNDKEIRDRFVAKLKKTAGALR